MYDYELRKLLGNDSYEEGSELVSSGKVSDPISLDYGMTAFRIDDGGRIRTVITREYGDGRPRLYDCDCTGKNCSHVAAVMIKEEQEAGEDIEDDQEVIEEIETMIDTLLEDIASDDYYDEDANYYEDWEIHKYGLENNNDEVEEHYTSRICDCICTDISEPNNAILLFHRLNAAIGKTEYDNGGFDNALECCDGAISAAFSCVRPEVLAEVLSEDTDYRGSWAEPYLDQVPAEIMAQAMGIMENSTGPLSKTVRKLLFQEGKYERFISSREPNLNDLIDVMKELKSKGDTDSLKAFAERLDGLRADCYNWQKFAWAYRAAGMEEKALEICADLFIKDPTQDLLNEISILDKDRCQPLLAQAIERHSESMAVSMMVLFASNGHADDVNRYIITKNAWPELTYDKRKYSLSGYLPLCRALTEHGFTETAGRIGRTIVKIRLEMKVSDSYQDAVDMMKLMDRYEEFETLNPPHSVYKRDLRESTRTMRKFWGMYDGTWVGKNSRRVSSW